MKCSLSDVWKEQEVYLDLTLNSKPLPMFCMLLILNKVHYNGRLSNTILAKATKLLPGLQGLEVLPDKKHVTRLKELEAFEKAVAGPVGTWLLVSFSTPWSESDEAKRGLEALGHAFDHGESAGQLRIAKVEVGHQIVRW